MNSRTLIPCYILPNSAWEFRLLHVLINTCYFQVFSYLKWYVVVFHCSINSHFFNISDVKYFVLCLLVNSEPFLVIHFYIFAHFNTFCFLFSVLIVLYTIWPDICIVNIFSPCVTYFYLCIYLCIHLFIVILYFKF